MTLSEVALYLKISEKSVLRMVHKNEIPCAKIASQWRFEKSLIDLWVRSKMRSVPKSDIESLIEFNPSIVPLSRLVDINLIIMNLISDSKEGILSQIVHRMVLHGICKDSDNFQRKLLLRENMISTAIGNGIAIPHLRNPSENLGNDASKLVIAICPEGTDFNSFDGEKTYVFFLLRTSHEIVHLRIMAKLNKMLKTTDVVSNFIKSESSEDIMSFLIEYDQQNQSEVILQNK